LSRELRERRRSSKDRGEGDVPEVKVKVKEGEAAKKRMDTQTPVS